MDRKKRDKRKFVHQQTQEGSKPPQSSSASTSQSSFTERERPQQQIQHERKTTKQELSFHQTQQEAERSQKVSGQQQTQYSEDRPRKSWKVYEHQPEPQPSRFREKVQQSAWRKETSTSDQPIEQDKRKFVHQQTQEGSKPRQGFSASTSQSSFIEREPPQQQFQHERRTTKQELSFHQTQQEAGRSQKVSGQQQTQYTEDRPRKSWKVYEQHQPKPQPSQFKEQVQQSAWKKETSTSDQPIEQDKRKFVHQQTQEGSKPRQGFSASTSQSSFIEREPPQQQFQHERRTTKQELSFHQTQQEAGRSQKVSGQQQTQYTGDRPRKSWKVYEQHQPKPQPSQFKEQVQQSAWKKETSTSDQPIEPTSVSQKSNESVKYSGKESGSTQPPKTTKSEISTEETTKMGKKIVKELMKTTSSFAIPSRRSTNPVPSEKYIMKKLIIEVNFLPLKIKDSKLKIYHYDCSFNPCTPKSLLRTALGVMRNKYFRDRNPAFDGKKNLYVAGRPLHFPNGDTLRDTVEVFDIERQKQKGYDITIKLVKDDLNLNRLMEYMKNGSSTNSPQEVIQATDIALRSQLDEVFISAGRSFFSPPAGQVVDLGDGLVLWHGFFQSAVMAWKPYLNVDVANKAFPRHQNVLDYLEYDLSVPKSEFANPLDQSVKRRLQQFLRGLKIEYRMPTSGPESFSKRTYKVNGLAFNSIEERFRPSETEKEICVAEYYQTMKNYRIQYPKLPLLDVGKNNKVPMELCSIVGKQVIMRKLDEKQTSNMVRNAARPTTERKQRIMERIAEAKYNDNPILKEFGISVESRFESVDAYVFKPPQIEYKNNQTANVTQGVWRSDNLKFIESPGLIRWGILAVDDRDLRSAGFLEQNLMRCGGSMGIPVEKANFIHSIRGRITEQVIIYKLQEYGRLPSPIQLVIVIMNNHPEIYSYIKRASELNTGVLTQCVKSRTMSRMNPMTAQNILLKINAKINGINHKIAPPMRPAIFNEPVIIIGADVTHPAPGSENVPSIAAVAASHDPSGFKYNMIYRLQASRMEMIVDLKNILQSQLLFFYKSTGQKPLRILYYRDGVSEGQFSQVLNIELQAIRGACMSLNENYKPGITFIVVQKRHHTRFFPNERDGDRKNCNVPAGTLVSSKITHPTELDFYLVSHQSIQGTARPTKYHLLWDDNNIEDEELERLTYYLCYMFTRCNRSVSYPAPTYYAHLGAFRARAYWDGQRVDLNNLDQEQSKGTIVQGIISNYPMFFV